MTSIQLTETEKGVLPLNTEPSYLTTKKHARQYYLAFISKKSVLQNAGTQSDDTFQNLGESQSLHFLSIKSLIEIHNFII